MGLDDFTGNNVDGDNHFEVMNQVNRYKLSSIPKYGSKGLTIKRGDHVINIIAVRQDAAVYCYHNICPHTGVNLEWRDDQFLDLDGKLILCATHGALFRIEDGKCISGPCVGQNLIPLKVKIDDDIFAIELN